MAETADTKNSLYLGATGLLCNLQTLGDVRTRKGKLLARFELLSEHVCDKPLTLGLPFAEVVIGDSHPSHSDN